MTRFTTGAGCNLIILLLMVSCASAPKKSELESALSDSHPDCKLDLEKHSPPLLISVTNNLFRGIKTTGSYTLTTLGYTTDTVLVGGGIVTLGWLCVEGNASNCGDAMGGYLEILDAADIISLGNKAYTGTSSWRCPNVDHISKALREVAKCNSRHAHYVAAFSQLDQVEMKPVLRDCISNEEKNKVTELRSQIETVTSTGGSN